jgi:hypothetical protein
LGLFAHLNRHRKLYPAKLRKSVSIFRKIRW